MKYTHILFGLLAILLIVGGCRKETQKFTISGNVQDGGFDKSLAGVTVQLLGSKIESGVYNSNYVEMGTATTDAQGNFSIEIIDELVAGYRFYVHKDDYFDEYEDIEVEVLEQANTFNHDFTLYPQASIKLKVKNTTPHSMDDLIEFWYTKSNSLHACKECCTYLETTGTGPMYDYEGECLVKGEQWFEINWKVTKNNYTILKKDSIYSTAFQTTTYQISY